MNHPVDPYRLVPKMPESQGDGSKTFLQEGHNKCRLQLGDRLQVASRGNDSRKGSYLCSYQNNIDS